MTTRLASSVADAQGQHQGYRWFVGGTYIGHLGPASNGLTSSSVTNAIIDAAHTSEAAMVAAMPGWLADWYNQELTASRQAKLYHECRYSPGVV